MTFLLIAAVVLFVVLAAAGIMLLNRGGVEPAARASERAPDPREERAVRRQVEADSESRAPSRLDEPPRDGLSPSS
jgi:hypothetical protein